MPVCLALAYMVDGAWLAEDLTWFSGAANREVRAPLRLLVTHFFNHQTHHRGQVHAMLTAAGQETGDTDLFLVVPRSSAVVRPSNHSAGRPCLATCAAAPAVSPSSK